MKGLRKYAALALPVFAAAMLTVAPAHAQATTPDTEISTSEFRAHKHTFGLVYTLPAPVNETLARTIGGLLRERLLDTGLDGEALRFNIPHVTVVHIHNGDMGTPEKMLAALPKPPAPLTVTLKKFYTTEAAKGAGAPWWLDLGIVKEGAGYEAMMRYNLEATAALAPLRDGPLPRVTGKVYGAMNEAGRELVRTVGVSGVNVLKDGKPTTSHNPHNTLVYSMTPYTPQLKGSFDDLAADFNQILPEGITTTFPTVSIVELGFAGNVLREIYRIDLKDGSALDVATGKAVAR